MTSNFLYDYKTSQERIPRFLILPDLLNVILARDDEFLWSDPERAALALGDEGGEVGPVLELPSELDVEFVHVVEEDNIFSLIPVPPNISRPRVY